MAWNPPCAVKYKKVKDNSLKSTQNYLVAHKAMDSMFNILDLPKFRDIRDWLQEKSSKKGYFPDFLIQDEKNGKKAIFNIPAFKKLDGINLQIDKKAAQQSTLFQKQSTEGQIASEKTLRDLTARIADRIGINYRFISDRSQEFKGRITKNLGGWSGVNMNSSDIAEINLAYATLDTPIHEILGHPIIRAIKNQSVGNKIEEVSKELQEQGYPKYSVTFEDNYDSQSTEFFNTKEEAENFLKNTNTNLNNLYQNLLKELETGKGKEVLDRIKRDYTNKTNKYDYSKGEKISDEEYDNIKAIEEKTGSDEYLGRDFYEKRIGDKVYTIQKGEDANPNSARVYTLPTYSLEEQQEEAIVELLGLMTAEKLDAVKDGKLISVLKRLLKEMKQFVRSLINQKEVEIDKLPDNMTINDLSDLLAYSNSKLILPGYEVEYTTPDNQQFKTYAEASNHISELAKSVEDVDLSSITLLKEKPKYKIGDYFGQYEKGFIEEEGLNKIETQEEADYLNSQEYRYEEPTIIKDFIEKNKEYEQSKEIIEEWKKVNNIHYNPEEIYSRGQEFSSVVGAYSTFDVNLMMQNLLQHIEDNEKAGGKFAISAYTKPVDRQIGHLEGGGGKIKFKIYPQSQDILWAANTDVYSGSVWDASSKVNKDKKSELLGVSYTKYPSLRTINSVQPNLASIVDDLNHHHNELGITLTGNNFRLEYDEDIPYQTKKIIDGINKILDQKYGKLIRPEINFQEKEIIKKYNIILGDNLQTTKDTYKEAEEFIELHAKKWNKSVDAYYITEADYITVKGKQPTKTKNNLKESISQIQNKFVEDVQYGDNFTDSSNFEEQGYIHVGDGKFIKPNKKEYTSQALINTKIAKLKEVAKKYPRSLIRSEVRKETNKYGLEREFFGEDLPFQKLSEKDKIKDLYQQAMKVSGERIEEKLKECE